jgi:hypothetical protein
VDPPYKEDIMVKRLLFGALLAGFAGLSLSNAAQTAAAAPSPVVKQAAPQKVRIPGTGYEVVVDRREATPRATQPPQALLQAIVTWLSNNFELPKHYAYPAISFEPARKIAVFRYTGLVSDRPEDTAMVPPGQRETVASYDPLTRTIFLPEGWTGDTPADLSMLVHEMVHHLQHAAHIKYECVPASEELAYAAQDKWLGLFGHDLATDFGLDGFTLLVAVRCIY